MLAKKCVRMGKRVRNLFSYLKKTATTKTTRLLRNFTLYTNNQLIQNVDTEIATAVDFAPSLR